MCLTQNEARTVVFKPDNFIYSLSSTPPGCMNSAVISHHSWNSVMNLHSDYSSCLRIEVSLGSCAVLTVCDATQRAFVPSLGPFLTVPCDSLCLHRPSRAPQELLLQTPTAQPPLLTLPKQHSQLILSPLSLPLLLLLLIPLAALWLSPQPQSPINLPPSPPRVQLVS